MVIDGNKKNTKNVRLHHHFYCIGKYVYISRVLGLIPRQIYHVELVVICL